MTFQDFLKKNHPREIESNMWNGDSSGRLALAKDSWETAQMNQDPKQISVNRELLEGLSKLWPPEHDYNEQGEPCWLPHVMKLLKELRASLKE